MGLWDEGFGVPLSPETRELGSHALQLIINDAWGSLIRGAN